jgi:tetratricopeptide (TPR) repeat protein
LSPLSADLYALGANIHAVQGNPHSSLQMAEKGLEHDPRHIGCLVQYGVTLFCLNRKVEAEVIFRQILTIDAEQPTAQGYVGHFEVQQGRYDLALPLLRNALRNQPHWALAQKAWRESLRGQYKVYGSVARMYHWVFEVHHWRVFGTLILVCMLIIGIGFFQRMPGFWQGLMITALLGLFAATFILLITVVLLLLYLGITSNIMLFYDRDLRRSITFRPTSPNPEPRQRPQQKTSVWTWVMIIYGILMLLNLLSKGIRKN